MLCQFIVLIFVDFQMLSSGCLHHRSNAIDVGYMFHRRIAKQRRGIGLPNVDGEMTFRNGHNLIPSYLKLIATVTGDWTSEGDAGVYIRTRLSPRRANSP